MRVLHVIPSLSAKHGGPSVALPLIARSLVQSGVAVDVATTDDDGPGGRLEVPIEQRVQQDGYGLFYFRKQTEFYKVSLPLHRWLQRHVCDYDLVHIHALFSFASVSAARAARRAGVPYIIRPLGVLNRWGMQNRRRRLKSLSFKFVERPILKHAAAIHYTADAERQEAEQAGARATAAVLPLGIDVCQFGHLPPASVFLERFPLARGREVVLFLSRVDAKKGFDLLLPAFSQVRARRPGALLVVAGNGHVDYVNQLKAEAEQLGIGQDILWTGFLGGTEKLAAFSAASVFVLPSHSENFGIALVEALAAGLPCIATGGVAVSEQMQKYAAGVVAPAEIGPLADAMDQVLGDASLRARLGSNARQMANEEFSLATMGKGLLRLYSDIVTARMKQRQKSPDNP